MTPKYHRNDPPFFVKFKNWIIANQGTISDRLYQRSGVPGDHEAAMTRGIVVSPAKASAGTALFIHGTGNDLTYPAVEIFKTLFAAGIETWAFDLDGHGQAGTSIFSRGTITEFMPWALSQLPTGSRVFVIGHSLGGSLALKTAEADQTRVAGLILISAPVKLSADVMGLFAEMKSATRPAVRQQIANYGGWGLLPAIGPFKRKKYPIRLQHQDNNYIEQVAQVITDLNLKKPRRSLSIPLLLIYGTGDLIVRDDNAAAIAGVHTNHDVMLIEGATHFSTIFEPGVANRISTFIGKNAT